MDDRELLKLAAKAAGIQLNNAAMQTMYMGDDGQWVFWNPFKDDGDALCLAVVLDMSVEISKHDDCTYAYAGKVPRVYAWEDWKGEKHGATRRAIVRAAAEIGKQMP